MKKILIALLVVLSVFALVSCSSNVTPTVTAETVTLSNETDGVSNVWSTKLAHNTSNYGVWYHDASGKYIDVLTADMALTNAAGAEIGTLSTAVEATEITDESEEGPEYGGTIYVYDEVTFSVKAGTDSASWTGELVVATKAVSDTELSGIVAKYNVTYTNTVEAEKTYDLGAIKLASGGDYEAADAEQVVAYGDTAVTATSIFEVISGGYKYVGAVDGEVIELGSDTVKIDGEDVAMATVTVEADTSLGHNGYSFSLNDYRTNSYKQFVDYSYAAKSYVIADSEVDLTGTTVIKGEPIVSFTLAADMPAKKSFAVGVGTQVTLNDIEVESPDEHVNLFTVNSKGHYVVLTEYYTEAKTGLAVGRVIDSTEITLAQLLRGLSVTFKREDAAGECDPDNVKGLDKISETIDVKLCAYTDIEDENTYRELASLKMFIENEVAYEYTLTNAESDFANYWYATGESLASLYYWDEEDGVWETGTYSKTSVADDTLTFTVLVDDTVCELEALDHDGDYVTFTLVCVNGDLPNYGDIYVKLASSETGAATHKIHFDCTVKDYD